jgi:hypothetical protein
MHEYEPTSSNAYRSVVNAHLWQISGVGCRVSGVERRIVSWNDGDPSFMIGKYISRFRNGCKAPVVVSKKYSRLGPDASCDKVARKEFLLRDVR